MMQEKMTGSLNNAAIVTGDSGVAICLVWLPEEMAGTKFSSIGYDDDEGAFLTSNDGVTIYIGDQMGGEAYDEEASKTFFRLHEFDSLGGHQREYDIEAIPREPVMSFGV